MAKDIQKHESQQKLAIAATFTSEPINDSLSYWLSEIGLSYSIEFAAYNQIFQEMLNPSSLFGSNRDGVNVVLVRFEDWEGNKHLLKEKDFELVEDEEILLQKSGTFNIYATRPIHKNK